MAEHALIYMALGDLLEQMRLRAERAGVRSPLATVMADEPLTFRSAADAIAWCSLNDVAWLSQPHQIRPGEMTVRVLIGVYELTARWPAGASK